MTPSILRNIDDEALYRHLQALVDTFPNFDPMTDDARRWLGRLSALVDEMGVLTDAVALKNDVSRLESGFHVSTAVAGVKNVLFRALAAAELVAPSAVQGAFVAAGNEYDAFAAVSRILGEAKKEILIVDPYMDATIFDFVASAPEGVPVRLLADEASVKPALLPAAARWISQFGQKRPLECRLAPRRALHDRSMIIDGSSAWIATQSFNALAQRSPASLSKLGGEAGQMKIEAYAEIWANAKQVS